MAGRETTTSKMQYVRRPIIGVIGSAQCDEEIYEVAREVGREIARQGCILVCGGLTGVMEAASCGAKEAGGVTIGILPGDSREAANPYIDIHIVTNMGFARNAIIALTADALIAVAGGYGTTSEIAFGLKLGKAVFALHSDINVKGLIRCSTPNDAIIQVLKTLKKIP